MKSMLIRDGAMVRELGANETFKFPSSLTRDTAAAGNTITANEFAADLYVRSGPTAAFTDTLPTGVLMDAFFVDAVVGDNWMVDILNKTCVTMTLAAGVGFTFAAGSPTFIAANGSTPVIVRKTGVATWTLELLNIDQRPSNIVVKDAAAAGVTITPAELWANLYHRSGPAAPFTDNLPTGAQMTTAFGATTPIGDGWLMEIVNASAVVMTVGPVVGFTLASAVTDIAAGARVACQVLRTGANAWTFEILG